MIAIINEKTYKLNSYYTESSSGRLHIYFNNEDQYDLDDLEADIKASEEMTIYAGEDNTSEVLAILRGYTIIRHLEKQYDMNGQIYMFIDVDSYESLIEGLKTEIQNLKSANATMSTKIINFDQAISNNNERINSLIDSVENINSRVVTLETAVSPVTTTEE